VDVIWPVGDIIADGTEPLAPVEAKSAQRKAWGFLPTRGGTAGILEVPQENKDELRGKAQGRRI
jgi:hypothetical protein